MTFIENIPIGFGLGRNPKYWETVLSNCIKFKPVTLENNNLPSVEGDTDILDIESVAAILKCSVDKIRRISRDELPARIGPGKKLLYHRADVLTYFNRLPFTGSHTQCDDAVSFNSLDNGFDINKAISKINENDS